MIGLRFNTDQSLFDAFPGAVRHIKTKPLNVPPLDFVDDLLKRDQIEDAVSFCAYLLPRREAVVWGCRSIRAIAAGAAADPGHISLCAAEAWADAPGEDRRRLALDRWMEADREDPRSWLALAAARAGGQLSVTNPTSRPAPQHLTPGAVRVALLLSLHRRPVAEKTKFVHDCLNLGVHLAKSGL